MVLRNIRVDVANLQKDSDMMSSGEFINMVLLNLLLVIRTDTDRLEVRRIAKVYKEPLEPIKHFKIKVCSRCLSLSSGDQESLSQARRSNSHWRMSSRTKTCTSLTSLHISVTHILFLIVPW